MAIQNRRGAYTDFDPTKMVAGEFAVVQSGDENTEDGKALYVAPTTGSVKRIPFADELGDLVEIDDTLTEAGAAADAKKTGDEIADLMSDLEQKGLSEDAKVALLNCFAHVAWIDEHGQDYYDALDDALYPLTNLVRITAEFTQGSAVIYATTPLNDLKAYLVVTGYYDNGRSAQITDYTLSGTLTVGTSTITVSASEKTTTFDVVVSPPYWDYEWYASSGELPAGSILDSGAEYDFTTESGALYIRKGFTLDFDYVGNCELVVELKCATYHGGSGSPMILVFGSVSGNNRNHARFQANNGVNNAYMSTNISGSPQNTNINVEQWHKYSILSNNGIYTQTVDDNLTLTGSGVTNQTSTVITGITLATYEVCYLKSIKFRRIQ